MKSGFFQPTLEEIRRAKFEQALDVMVRIAMRLVKKEKGENEKLSFKEGA